MRDGSGKDDDDKMSVILEADRINKIGRINKRILSDVSFSVNEEESIMITGPEGSGKTTLSRIISGLDSEYEGKIFFRGNDIDPKGTGFPVGYISGTPELISGISLLENAMIPLISLKKVKNYHEAHEMAYEVFKLIDIESAADMFPEVCSDYYKVAAAMAGICLSNPDMIVFDDPDVRLDKGEFEKLWSSFKKIYTGPFIVMTGNENLPVNGLSGVYRLDKGELYK